MEFKEVVQRRRSVRRYEERPIPDDVLRQLLEAGLWAPSGVNMQPWFFAVIRSPEQMQRLAAVMDRVSDLLEPRWRAQFAKHPAVAGETAQFVRNMGGAPVCILVFQFKADYTDGSEAISLSIGAAIENILLSAVDHGLAGCWLTAPVEAKVGEELRQAFAPEHGRLVSLLTLGYPAQEPSAPPRKECRYAIFE